MRSVTPRSLVIVDGQGTPGALGQVTGALGQAGVNIEGFSIQAGRMAFLMDDPREARKALESHGFPVEVIPVVGLDMPNEPGSLASLIEALHDAGVHIIHSFGMGHGRGGAVYVKMDDLERALPVLDGMPGVTVNRAKR